MFNRPGVPWARGFVLAALLAVPGCARDNHPAPTLKLTPCHVDRLAEEVLCGTQDVFEDRAAASGDRIPIHVAVLPALRAAPRPDPLFILAGGPGQGARSYAPLVAAAFKAVRRTRDIVLVDLRGTGDSGPLNCPASADLSGMMALLEPARVRDCAAALHADPRQYTHTQSLADLDEVRRRLGYERINLWGGSWGTRAAWLYAAMHPAAVRTVVLDGAVPFAQPFPASASRDGQRALDLLIRSCERDRPCAERFPALRRRIASALASFVSGPFTTEIAHPRTGELQAARLTLASLAEAVRVALYSPRESGLIPFVLERLATGDVSPLMAMVLGSASWSTDVMAIGVTFSVLCSEDIPRLTEQQIREETTGTFLGRLGVEAWRAACAVWPIGPPLDVDADRVLPIPALILSGDLDPVTPPRWGDAMARAFRSSLHVVAPGAGHNVSFGGCIPDLIADFVERGAVEGLDARCASGILRPPMVFGFAGPRP